MSGCYSCQIRGHEIEYVEGRVLLRGDYDLDDPEMREDLRMALEIAPVFYALDMVHHSGGNYPDTLRQFFDDTLIAECLHIEAGYREIVTWPQDALILFAWLKGESESRASRVVKKGHVYKSGYLYLLRSTTGYFKIGRTTDPTNRIKTFEVKLPFEVAYEHVFPTDDMFGMEKALHSRFAEKRVNGEWFALAPDDVEYIKSLGGAS
jgi:hypothetical protein